MANKRIKNPLTIVGIFAGIAQVAGTTVIAFLSQELQSIFIWYVMGFPILLVILFFATWNFNPSVLYAPNDYLNEDNFITILTKKYKVDNDIIGLESLVDKTREEIINEAKNAIRSSESFEQLIETKMDAINDKLIETKQSASDFTDSSIKHTDNIICKTILFALWKGSLTLDGLSAKTKLSKTSLIRGINILISSKSITCEDNGEEKLYSARIYMH